MTDQSGQEALRPLRVVVYMKDNLRGVLQLNREETKVGRGPENDLVLVDAKVSRLHCKIRNKGGYLWIEDWESSNGLTVNGRQTTREVLKSGDRVGIGPFTLHVEDVPADPPEAGGAAAAVAPAAGAPGAAAVAAVPGGAAKEVIHAEQPTRPLPPAQKGQILSIMLPLLESFNVDVPLEELLSRILKSLITAIDGDRAFLYRYDPEKGEARRVFGFCRSGIEASKPVSEPLILKTARERVPCLVTGSVADRMTEMPSIAETNEAGSLSMVMTPLLHDGRMVGVLYADCNALRHSFSTDHMDLMTRSGRYLAGVLNHFGSHQEMSLENRRLKAIIHGQLEKHVPLDKLLRDGSPMAWVISQIERVAPMEVPVLVTGEAGTEMHETAVMVHLGSRRGTGPFIRFNCGSLAPAQVEGELFGYLRGAFPEASEDRPGLIELAQGGTLYLEEVAELSTSAQTRLNRVLSEHKSQRIGATASIEVDFRLIVSTTANLELCAAQGAFLEELYLRIRLSTIPLPPLRDRLCDLPELVNYYIHEIAPRVGKHVSGAAPDLVPTLEAYRWPGNLEELKVVLKRAVVHADQPVISRAFLPPEFTGLYTPSIASIPATTAPPAEGEAVRPYAEELESFEREYLRRLQQRAGNDLLAMAQMSGMSRILLEQKLHQLGLLGTRTRPLGA